MIVLIFLFRFYKFILVQGSLLIHKFPTNCFSWVFAKHQLLQCPLCVDVKFVNRATMGYDLVLDNFIITVISSASVLKRVPKDSRTIMAKNLLHHTALE